MVDNAMINFLSIPLVDDDDDSDDDDDDDDVFCDDDDDDEYDKINHCDKNDKQENQENCKCSYARLQRRINSMLI